MKQIMVVVGTRPEIVKMAPIIRALKKSNVPMTLTHCGQHYDYNMSQQFIEELNLPNPDHSFKFKATSQNMQMANIIIEMNQVLERTDSSLILVEGDTNTVMAAALSAIKLGRIVGHVEAGLRSFDFRMPEEYNRRLTDHMSSYLFAPTKTAERNLEKENVWGKVFITGNTVIDAVIQHLPVAESKSNIMSEVRFSKFALATAHRAENVDDPKVLKNLIEAFKAAPLPVVYPIHPRTRIRLEKMGVYSQLSKSDNVQLMPPVGYLDFLLLMKNCELIVTDSGGIQEEATSPPIRKPVLVIRMSTERPEAVEAGFSKVVGTDKKKILKHMEKLMQSKNKLPARSPYGDGFASEEIVKILKRYVNS